MRPRSKNGDGILSKLGPVFILVIIFIVFSICSSKFLKVDNIMNIFKQTSINGFISLGMLIVLITAGIDLSVGANCAFSACVMGLLFKSGCTNPVILIVVCIGTATGIGLINGLLLTKLHLPHPFISTLGMCNIVRGFALFLTNAATINNFPKGVTFIGSATIGGFPLSFFLLIVFCVIFHFMLTQTGFGRQIYCVGGNFEAAKLSGIKSDRVLTLCYTICGVVVGIAAVIMVGRVGTAYPLAGDAYDTDAIASCIIGGASFMGGKGTVVGTLIGALFIAILRNGLSILGASSYIQQIVLGFVIIGAVFFDVMRGMAEAKARRLAAE